MEEGLPLDDYVSFVALLFCLYMCCITSKRRVVVNLDHCRNKDVLCLIATKYSSVKVFLTLAQCSRVIRDCGRLEFTWEKFFARDFPGEYEAVRRKLPSFVKVGDEPGWKRYYLHTRLRHLKYHVTRDELEMLALVRIGYFVNTYGWIFKLQEIMMYNFVEVDHHRVSIDLDSWINSISKHQLGFLVYALAVYHNRRITIMLKPHVNWELLEKKDVEKFRELCNDDYLVNAFYNLCYPSVWMLHRKTFVYSLFDKCPRNEKGLIEL